MGFNRFNRRSLNKALIERKTALSEGNENLVCLWDEYIHQGLLALRRKIRREEQNDNYCGGVVLNRYADDEGYACVKILYPGEAWTEDEMRTYRKANVIHLDLSLDWDCTTQRFTTSIDIFNVPDGVLVWHFTAIDW